MNQLTPRPVHALITGGAGFIGSHLSEYLIAQGQTVHVVDDLSTGAIANLDSLKQNPDFAYTITDVRDEPLMAELVDRADVIYHLAAAVGVRLIVESPVQAPSRPTWAAPRSVLKLANKKGRKVHHRLHQRGLRQERPGALWRGPRPGHGPHLQGALVLCLLQGH